MLSDQRRFDHELVKGYRTPTREQQPSLNALNQASHGKTPTNCVPSRAALLLLWSPRQDVGHQIGIHPADHTGINISDLEKVVH